MIDLNAITFTRKGNSEHALVDLPQVGTLRAEIRNMRGLDGRMTSARTWEVVVRRPVSKILACGTSASKREAEAAVAHTIERIARLRGAQRSSR